MIIYNLLNPPPITYERNTSPDMTVPDQTMSIREIMARYTRGIPIDQGKIPIYEGEDGIDVDLKRLDYADRQEIIQKFKEELNTIQDRVKQRNKPETPKNDLKTQSTDSTPPGGEEGPLD